MVEKKTNKKKRILDSYTDLSDSDAANKKRVKQKKKRVKRKTPDSDDSDIDAKKNALKKKKRRRCKEKLDKPDFRKLVQNNLALETFKNNDCLEAKKKRKMEASKALEFGNQQPLQDSHSSKG